MNKNSVHNNLSVGQLGDNKGDHEDSYAAPTLQQLQSRFWNLITAPNGVVSGLQAVASSDPDAAPLESWMGAKDGAGIYDKAQATERLNIYANMYFFRLLGVLREDFPALLHMLGDANFSNLVTDYLISHPSIDPSVRNFGQSLNSFLEQHPLADIFPGCADLSRLEWARLYVFDETDPTKFNASALLALSPEQWPTITFELNKALTVLPLTYLICPLWAAANSINNTDETKTTPPPLPTATKELHHVIVWRQEFKVYHRTALPYEALALQKCSEGICFAEVCAAIAEATNSKNKKANNLNLSPTTQDAWQDEQQGAELMVGLLQQWISDGFISHITK